MFLIPQRPAQAFAFALALASAFRAAGSVLADSLPLGDAFEPTKCHALVVGVLEWKDPRFASFSKEQRQDVAFAKTLEARGVPSDHITLLLDEQATLANIEEQLARVSDEAGPGSTLLFYYAGHGTRGDGSFCFANYDMTGAADGLRVERIGELIEDHFEGERVLLFADCCHSGALSHVVDRLAAGGFEAACVTSVVEENTSTGNWTFTQTLIEAFGGDPSLDVDDDGAIERGELEAAVRGAMAARESQRFAAHAGGIAADFPLAKVVMTPEAARFRKSPTRTQPAAAQLGDHVREAASGRVGRVVGLDADDEWIVRTYDYATHADAARPREQLEPLTFETKPVDTLVGVRRGRDHVVGRVVEVDAPFHRVLFPAWPELTAEWFSATQFEPVPAEFDATRACMVEWRGTWYPALTLRAEEPDWWIHYVGYGANWDERVGPDRIRFTLQRSGQSPGR